jgi:two-component system, OmpR family, response regulator VicR
MKILVVEDEKRMAQALRRGLEEERYSVTVTADGISAVELAESDRFDLILLDLMLPRLDDCNSSLYCRGGSCRFPLSSFGNNSRGRTRRLGLSLDR